jgi:FixJ family two-component response regulator
MGSRISGRVVLVDDDSSISNALVRMLKLAGFTPLTFGSAEALLAARSAASAECLVLDVHLPGLTGFELYERLQSEGGMPPVIFITAYDEPESRDQAGAAGAAAYFTKPFSGNDLVSAVRQAIGTQAAAEGM